MPRISVVPAHESLGPQSLDSLTRLGVDHEVTTVARARGDYLLLLPPGDVLLPHGLTALLEGLDASGSDAAVGTGTTAGPASAAGRAGAATRATTLTGTPELATHEQLAAVLWRRDFWTSQQLSAPHGPGWEPMTVLRGMLVASSIDVVPEAVTVAQASGARKATLRPALLIPEIADLADQLAELSRLGEALPDTAQDAWFLAVVEPRLRRALRALPEAGGALSERLVGLVGDLTTRHERALADVRTLHRLQYHLASRGKTSELLVTVLAEHNGTIAAARVQRVGDGFVADYPFRGDPAVAVPDEVYRIDHELVVRGRIEQVRWQGSRLRIAGYSHIALLDLTAPESDRVELALVRGSDGRRVPLPVERVYRPDVTAQGRDAACRYDWSGFRTSAEVLDLQDGGRWRAGTWRLEVTIEHQGVRRSRALVATAPGAARHPQHWTDGDVRVVPVTGRGTFVIEIDPTPARLVEVAVVDDAVQLEIALRHRATRGAATLHLTSAWGSTVVEVPARLSMLRRRVRATVPLDALRERAVPGLEQTWALRLQLPAREGPLPVRAQSGAPTRWLCSEPQLTLGATPHGRVALVVRDPVPVVEHAEWDGPHLVLNGRWPGGDESPRLEFVSRDTGHAHRVDVAVDGEFFTCRWDPSAVPTMAGVLPLPQGTWLPRATVGTDGHVRGGQSLLATLPAERQVGAKTFTLTEESGVLHLRVGPDLEVDERGVANQLRLRTKEFPAFVAQGVRAEVLFESYESRAYADNARAIAEELLRRGLPLRCSWVVVDGQTELPEGITAVSRRSREHYRSMARAQYVVVPNYRDLRDWHQRPPGQVVVQTWHGAPFKRIGLDNPRGRVYSAFDYTEIMRRESAGWDYLLSPNPPSTAILRRAFSYDGPVLETGYPRTDVFHSPDAPRAAERVRERLGLPEGKRVVLYAPTMRDDLNYGGNRYRLDLRLELDKARAALADDHVLLVRNHAKVVDPVPVDGDFARDVSLWPDVNELLLATDVLVTDYSSLMFDFANTGRPMLFFTYDLADYRDRLRGLYFDADRMPGPHLATSAEVVAAVREAERLRDEYDGVYRAFVEEFCAWDDGKAAARFVDQVFSEHL